MPSSSRQQLTTTFHLPDRDIPLVARKVKGARRVTLRYRPLTRDVLLTLPPRMKMADALAFAQSRAGWLAKSIENHGISKPFVDGATIPLLGSPITLRHVAARGTAHLEDGTLTISCDPAFFSRRTHDWLKARMRQEVESRAHAKAARLGKQIRRISLRDTGSRWGSCNSRGELSFSWRLIFAPEPVLDYLISHEVAHLAEMNHSPRFWAHVTTLCPHYEQAQAWLNRHGPELYHYG